MVYEDESRNDLSSLDNTSSSDDMMYRIPASINDKDYMGIENSALDVCLENGLPPERRVAFKGFETGRRFLVCAQPPPQNCGFVGWVDQEWPPTMQNALLKLWEMLEDSKSARRDDNLENSLKIHHLTEEKRNIDANYDKLVEDVNQLLNLAEAQGSGVISDDPEYNPKEDEVVVHKTVKALKTASKEMKSSEASAAMPPRRVMAPPPGQTKRILEPDERDRVTRKKATMATATDHQESLLGMDFESSVEMRDEFL
ncbi:hypothetical protein D1007_40435 [Hordeum vulgare]|nr:hypothetical protein D1007_40435 [Hordeum vulgare]